MALIHVMVLELEVGEKNVNNVCLLASIWLHFIQFTVGEKKFSPLQEGIKGNKAQKFRDWRVGCGNILVLNSKKQN